MSQIAKARNIAQMIEDDCAEDAKKLDTTPFTARGTGETFGNILAMIAGLAAAVRTLADEAKDLREEIGK